MGLADAPRSGAGRVGRLGTVPSLPVGRIAAAHGRLRPWSARSPHHLLHFWGSLFVLLGKCVERIVGTLFAPKVSF